MCYMRQPVRLEVNRRGALLGALCGIAPPVQRVFAESSPLARITSTAVLGLAIGNTAAQPVTVGLFGEAAPASVELFERLCTGTIPGEPQITYAGSTIYRVEPGRLIEVGSRLSGNTGLDREIDATGRVRSTYIPVAEAFGNSDSNALSHDRPGLLSMRRGGKAFDFLLTTGADPSLDAERLVVGEVTSGASVLAAIDALPVRRPSQSGTLGGVAALYGLRAGVAGGVASTLAFRLNAPGLGLGVGALALAGMQFVGDDPRTQQDLSYRPLTKVRVVNSRIER